MTASDLNPLISSIFFFLVSQAIQSNPIFFFCFLQMEKLFISCKQIHNQLWFTVFVSIVLCIFLLCLNYSAVTHHVNNDSFTYSQDFPTRENKFLQGQKIDGRIVDPCSGKYIYVHRLPTRFNSDLLKDCRTLNKWFNMCSSMMNSGFGPKIRSTQGFLTDTDWFETNQFLLEVIFHDRMKRYECLTNDSSLASAVFVPFYAGLDVGRYLWDYNTSVRDSLAYDIVDWLRKQGEWKRLWGRDHFFVAGRVAWDFRRQTGNQSDWGNKLMSLPESMNMTMLSIESSSYCNEIAIPYPTYFHPSTDIDVISWQKRARSRKRRYLFSFAGAPRPSMNDSIRGQIISQCLASENTCKFLDCKSGTNKCDTPVEVIKVFQNSIFCLQPPGDSFTRRSTFDSILAGCIPVFFQPCSAYAQYTWYFPKNYTRYSVYIPTNDIKHGRVSIEETLSRFSEDQVLAMRKEVVKLIPKVIYRDPKSRFERFEDAFDVAVKGIIDRVEKVKKDVEEGKDPSNGFAAWNCWKLKLSGIIGDPPLEQAF